MKKSRQVLRREAREDAKLESLKLPTFSGQNRRIRRMAGQIVSTVGNNRKTTRGRDIHYQYIYNVLDDKGKKLMSFGTSAYMTGDDVIPPRVFDKLVAILNKKERTVKGVTKIPSYKVVFDKTIKHKQPSLTFVKVMELVLKTRNTL